jgi:hypothetical protein
MKGHRLSSTGLSPKLLVNKQSQVADVNDTPKIDAIKNSESENQFQASQSAASDMAGKKRAADESQNARHSKKLKVADSGKTKHPKSVQPVPTSALLTEDVDFPRGGGTTLTPAEVKATRAEGIKEANEELIKVCPGCRVAVR